MAVKEGRDWVRTGGTAGCMALCIGPDPDKLRSCLIDVVRPEMK